MKSFLVIASVLSISVLLYFLPNNKENESKASTNDEIDYNYHIRPILSDRCFKCHGPDERARKADLRLDNPEGAFSALKDQSNKFAIVAGNPELSELVFRINTMDTSLMMPPPDSHLELTAAEKEIITKWVKQGAKYKKHWSFILPEKSTKLPLANNEWVKNPIDNFVLAKMKEQHLQASEEADKEQILKRLCLDLTGLPPSLHLQDQFLADNSENSYERLIDTLLASKHYGEKMASYWLDVARYADSHGYQDDGLRTMWPWRDWVIHAFNSNYSYRQFITWQLAGDILAGIDPNTPNAKEMILATGFNRNHKITQEGGVIDEEYRIEYVTDRTNTFGKSMLALTFECAKCHDHKYDPISQKDYYSTFAFFNQVPEKGLQGDIQLASLADPPKMEIKDEELASIFSFINKKDSIQLHVMVMADSVPGRPTYLLRRGNYDDHGDEVTFGLPDAILPYDQTTYYPNRLGLTQWLFDPKNPLTARVYVNRIWEQFFGRGIVKTSGDFGMQGELPSHPDLLDWLAVDFMEHNWDIKYLIKTIVNSATYRQSSNISKNSLERDPENIYLSHASRLRLPAENIRDLVLSTSGTLNEEIGGPSVKTYQPDGIWESATSGRGVLARYKQDHGKDLFRRGMYVFIKRTVPPPNMLIFDSSNRDQCEVQRSRTNTPLQALVMLNDPHVIESAKALAQKELTANINVETALQIGFRRIICRTPSKKELEILKNTYDSELAFFKAIPGKIAEMEKIGELKMKGIKDKACWAALAQTYHMIYNMEEALMRI